MIHQVSISILYIYFVVPVERERSEDTFTCFQRCSSNWSTSNLYAVNATTFLVHLLVLVENTNTSAISIEYASMLSGEVAYTSDIEIRYKIQCSKSNLNNDDGNGIVALHKGTVLTFTVNQFATCDISYVLRIKTSEFICKESVHILCALSMKQYWSNLVYSSFPCKRDTYVSTEIMANQSWWMRIQVRNLWYCIKIQLQHSNQIRYILIYEGENVSIQNRNLCIGYQYQRWKFSREW